VGPEVPGAAARITQVCTGHDYSRPGKPKIDRDDPQAKDALVSALVNDANAPDGEELAEPAASAVAPLALVAGQDVELAGGSDGTDRRWRIARKVAEVRVISTVDPDARHTRKSPEARRTDTAPMWLPIPGPGSSPMRSRPGPPERGTPMRRSRWSSWRLRPPEATTPPAAQAAMTMTMLMPAAVSSPRTPIRPTAPGTCAPRSAGAEHQAVIKALAAAARRRGRLHG
jgi:hypothetical protein